MTHYGAKDEQDAAAERQRLLAIAQARQDRAQRPAMIRIAVYEDGEVSIHGRPGLDAAGLERALDMLVSNLTTPNPAGDG
jgi:hypothetical protein